MSVTNFPSPNLDVCFDILTIIFSCLLGISYLVILQTFVTNACNMAGF